MANGAKHAVCYPITNFIFNIYGIHKNQPLHWMRRLLRLLSGFFLLERIGPVYPQRRAVRVAGKTQRFPLLHARDPRVQTALHRPDGHHREKGLLLHLWTTGIGLPGIRAFMAGRHPPQWKMQQGPCPVGPTAADPRNLAFSGQLPQGGLSTVPAVTGFWDGILLAVRLGYW